MAPDVHDEHKDLYFQIRENTKAQAELRTQVALMVQSTQHIAEATQNVARAIASHVDSHKKNASTFKTSAINFAFNMLGLGIAGGVGAAIAQFAAN